MPCLLLKVTHCACVLSTPPPRISRLLPGTKLLSLCVCVCPTLPHCDVTTDFFRYTPPLFTFLSPFQPFWLNPASLWEGRRDQLLLRKGGTWGMLRRSPMAKGTWDNTMIQAALTQNTRGVKERTQTNTKSPLRSPRKRWPMEQTRGARLLQPTLNRAAVAIRLKLEELSTLMLHVELSLHRWPG